MEAVAHPAPGTHCPGTLGKHSEAGEVEVVLWAMGASWILQSGQSSASQVMGKGLVCAPSLAQVLTMLYVLRVDRCWTG